MEKCPICENALNECNCRVCDTSKNDMYKKRQVVLDHLYLFSPEQIQHIIDLERDLKIAYGDSDRSKILIELEKERQIIGKI